MLYSMAFPENLLHGQALTTATSSLQQAATGTMSATVCAAKQDPACHVCTSHASFRARQGVVAATVPCFITLFQLLK